MNWFPSSWHGVLVPGEPFLLATVVKDISESKRIEEELCRHDVGSGSLITSISRFACGGRTRWAILLSS
jgi:hypothetical protein